VSELKPCPFCGGKPFCAEQEHLNPKVGEYWIVGCGNDDCPVDTCFVDQPSKAEAIASWNRRAAPVVTEEMARRGEAARVRYMENVAADRVGSMMAALTAALGYGNTSPPPADQR